MEVTLGDRLAGAILRVRPAPLAVFLKKIFGIRRHVVGTSEGQFWVDPATVIGRSLLETGIFEPELVNWLKQVLISGGVFVDLGANEGYFTVIGSRAVGRLGRVIAIEPQQRLVPVIRRNLELNDLDNVSVEASAISDRPGTGSFYLSPDTNTGSSGFINLAHYAVPNTCVTLKTLTQALKEHGVDRVDCLKVDIEGAEYEAMLGSAELFRTHKVRAIALELHPRQLAAVGRSEHDITSLLVSSGYIRASMSRPNFWSLPSGA